MKRNKSRNLSIFKYRTNHSWKISVREYQDFSRLKQERENFSQKMVVQFQNFKDNFQLVYCSLNRTIENGHRETNNYCHAESLKTLIRFLLNPSFRKTNGYNVNCTMFLEPKM